MARKIALLVGSSKYADARLSQLKGPPLDVTRLAEVLRDPDIGGFEPVHELINEPYSVVRRSVFDLFDGVEREDLLLLYISGHGVLDTRHRLFFAVSDTDYDRRQISALPASEVQDHMSESPSRRQVIILDSCFSGAFYPGTRGAGRPALTEETFGGYGREVLTASTATQYAFEGDELVEGEPPNGLGTFTHFLIEGLRTGAAAPDSIQISAAALFDYVSREVRSANPRMRPQRWSEFRDNEPLIIARNPLFRAKDPSREDRRASLLTRLAKIGLAQAPNDNQIQTLLRLVEEREAEGYAYGDANASFELLVRHTLGQVPDYFRLIGFRIIDERRFNARNELVTLSEATIKVEVGGATRMIVAEGNGPVHALDTALRQALSTSYAALKHMYVADYKVDILTPKTVAAAVTRVIIESADDQGRRWSTVGVSTNVIDASCNALHDGITYKLFVDGAPAVR